MNEPNSRPLRVATLALALSLIYAIVRYHVFKGVAWSQLPLYTLNKAVSVAALVLVAAALRLGLKVKTGLDGEADASQRHDARRLGILAAAFGVWHAVMSAVLSTPRYFPSYFDESASFTASAGASFAAGATALAILARLSSSQGGGAPSPGRRSRWVIVALFLVAGHTALIGYPGWIDVAAWPGKMPPITLLSALLALLAAVSGLRRWR